MSAAKQAPVWPAPPAFTRYFVDTFADARESWRRLARSAGPHARLRSFAHTLHGPLGEDLATDCLWWGEGSARKVIVLISGTHGIEGYAGSALQRYLLDGLCQGELAVPSAVAILFVHALTPWGMAWYRRCDEDGVDLNRHFVDLSHPPSNPEFERVRPCLALPDETARRQALAALAQELGQRAYEEAVSGGQYIDPHAPYYGGARPNHGRRVTDRLFSDYDLASRDLVVLDLHTGLGHWGHGELICDHPPDSAGARIARQLFGAAVTQPALGTSSSVPKHGLLDYAWHARMNDHSCFLTLEFGTYSTQDLFDRVIEDHQFWAKAPPRHLDDTHWSAVRARMLGHFYPQDPHWRQGIALASLQVLRRTLEGL